MRYISIAVIGLLLLGVAGCPAGRRAENNGGAAAPAPGGAAGAEAAGRAAEEARPREESTAELAKAAQGFHFGEVFLGQSLEAVGRGTGLAHKTFAEDTVGADGNGEMVTAEQEKFVFRDGALVAYAAPAIYGMSTDEYERLAADASADYPDAQHGTGSAPAGYYAPAGDNANATRLDYWLKQDPPELLLTGWRDSDGYYWEYMAVPEEKAAAGTADETVPGGTEEPAGPS
jgi:hypothetical protein